MRAAVLLLLLIAASALAQDAERGRRLFNQTAAVTGRPVANCTSCHADPHTLRALLANRLVAVGDAKAIRVLLQAAIAGATPGARNAKAQYRNVLTDKDLDDLAAYLARVQTANYINAYTFPGGAMGVTRGIMTELKDESELAALLGHEMGHVNARHAAQRQGQALLAQAAVAGIAAATSDSQWGGLAALASQIGASALLASYSRDNEREADALGQEYMVRAGYPAGGMTHLHALLVREAKEKPGLLETMFSSHPMSSERLATAQRLAETKYAASRDNSVQRERFMDNTAGLRNLKPAIDACKNGELALARKKLPEAEGQFSAALAHAPRDYASNLLMARCLHAQGRRSDALRFADAARAIYPQEAQAHKLAGTLQLAGRNPAAAFQHFDQFDKLLPGDPGITFLKGVSLEGAGQQRAAAEHYARFLKAGAQGKPAEYSLSRLKAWGYVK